MHKFRRHACQGCKKFLGSKITGVECMGTSHSKINSLIIAVIDEKITKIMLKRNAHVMVVIAATV